MTLLGGGISMRAGTRTVLYWTQWELEDLWHQVGSV